MKYEMETKISAKATWRGSAKTSSARE